MTRVSLLLFFSIFAIACNGQGKTQSHKIGKVVPNTHINKTKAVNIAKDAGFFCGIHDKNGRLWFGTCWKGVYRYDGNSFTNFTEKDGLQNNRVRSILEDNNGNIWIGTDVGVCRYDGTAFTDIPVSITNNNYLQPLNAYSTSPSAISSVKCLFQDKTGKIWVGAREGVFCYNGTALTPFSDNSNIINENNLHLRDIQCMFQDKNNNIWFASGGTGMGEDGICLFDGKTLTNFKPEGYGRGMGIIEDKNGNLLFSSGYAIFSYDGKTFTNLAKKAGLKLFAYDMLKDKTGNIWLTAENEKSELSLYRYDGKSFDKFTTKEDFNYNDISSIVEDNSGNIWFGTGRTGLYRYNGKTFTHFAE